MDYTHKEYLDFYRNRNRVKAEIAAHAKEYKDRLQYIIWQNTDYARQLTSLQSLLSILIEQSNMANSVVLQDLAVREHLSESLKLNRLPNNGYLMKQKLQTNLLGLQRASSPTMAKQAVPSRPKTSQAMRRKGDRYSAALQSSEERDSGRSSSPAHNLHSSLSAIKKLAFLNPDESLVNLASEGSLYLKTLEYRQRKIASSDLQKYFEQMNARLESVYAQLVD